MTPAIFTAPGSRLAVGHSDLVRVTLVRILSPQPISIFLFKKSI